MDPLTLLASAVIAQGGYGYDQGNHGYGGHGPGGYPQATPTWDDRSDGQFFEHSQPIQELTLRRIIYQGDCPGESIQPIKNISFLAATPPAGKQRIVIRNRRTGGYTDREYDGGRSKSERFWISLGTKQHGSFLAVQPGENQFRWKLKKATNPELPRKGTAVLYVHLDDQVSYRSFSSIHEDAYCPGEKYNSTTRTPLHKCQFGYYVLEREGVCPNGNKVQLGNQRIYRN